MYFLARRKSISVVFLPIHCGINPIILMYFTTNQDFKFGVLSTYIFISKHKRGEFSLVFTCFGKEREYMAGCVLQAGISGGKL